MKARGPQVNKFVANTFVANKFAKAVRLFCWGVEGRGSVVA
jgi:hypothetical protein